MTDFLERRNGSRIAYNRLAASAPELPFVMFLGGFRSDMEGTKALYLETRCRERGQGFVRFDYSGHGQSSGRFASCTLEDWRDDALDVMTQLTDGPVVLAGSSMGGWIGLVLALRYPEKVCGYVGIAAAPDFTTEMMERGFTDAMKESLRSKGFAEVPSDYSPEPYIITQTLIDSGTRLSVLGKVHGTTLPVRLVQGKRDTDVDWTTPEKIRRCLPHADIKIHLIEDGDHRLSRVEDLDLIDGAVRDVSAICACT